MFPLKKKFPVIAISFVIVAIIIQAVPALGPIFEYNRGAILNGEFWRLITGHFPHVTFEQFFWDVLLFAAAAGWCEINYRKVFYWVTGCSIVATSLGILLFEPQMFLYRGLSGINYALFILGSGMLLFDQNLNEAKGLKLLLAGIITAFFFVSIYEIFWSNIGLSLATEEMQPVPLVHLIGCSIGLIFALLNSGFENFKPGRPFVCHSTSI